MQLDHFGLEDLLECSSQLKSLGQGQTSMEGAAGEIVRDLHARFIDKRTGQRALPLVRFYKVLPFERLEPELQDVALAAGPGAGSLTGVPCLTLLASAGEEPAWNDRRQSRSHRAIPLPSREAVLRLPMVAGLVTELGLDVDDVVQPPPERLELLDRRTYGVFYVPDAVDSPLVPAQKDFVVPYGIRSVVGFGGMLPSGSLFAVVMFSTTPISQETADAFDVIALSVKVAVLPFVERQTFEQAGDQGAEAPLPVERALRIAESRAESISQLLAARETAVRFQSTRLRMALADAHNRAEELAASRAELAASEARHAAIVRGALDSIISIDADGRVLEFNPAAEATFGYRREDVIGEELADLIMPMSMVERHRQGLRHYLETGEGPILNRRVEVSARRSDGTELPIELTVTPVVGANPPIFTGYLRDITEQRQAEAELLASRERLAHVARTLQTSLLPPLLPEISGLELASLYRPALAGNEVGGDFYDAFELSDSCWAFALGDVCGKGPEAAAVTALVRYTLRAAAMRNPGDPAGVLDELHRAMLAQRPDSFATVAYAVLDTKDLRLELVLGGHPQMVRWRDGEGATEIGSHGPIVGMIDRWPSVAQSFVLEPGDVVVLYSDGVVEARRGSEELGVDRLLAVIDAAAADGPKAVTAAIDQAVSAFSTHLADDVAALAFGVPAS